MPAEDFSDDELESLAYVASPLALASRVTPGFRARKQQKVISDAIVRALTGTGPRFIAVSVPQQFGKSFITSINTPAWWIEMYALGAVPGGLVGLISNEDSLAMSWSVKTRRLIKSRPDVFTAEVRKDSKAARYWETNPTEGQLEGGGIIATGIGGSIVGRPLSLIVFDDPTKNPEQAASQSHRDKVWELWQSVGVGRLQPWTVVLVVMTRWHSEDLIGRLLSDEYEGDPSEWEYIRIPAICDEQPDPVDRAIGEALLRPQAEQTPEQALHEMESVQRRISSYTWNTMWQQNPVDPEGTIFFESRWRYWGGDSDIPLPSRFDQVFMSWDMSFKGSQTSDWVVGQAWGGLGADRYLIDQVRGHWGFSDTCRQLTSFAERIRSTYTNALGILVEDKANGPAVLDALRSKVGGIIEFPVNQYGSKQARANAVQPLLLGGNLYIPARSENSWVDGYIRELADFDRGKHDDQVDATTQALLWMQKNAYAPSEIFTASAGSTDISPFERKRLERAIDHERELSRQDAGLWIPRSSPFGQR